MNVSVRRLALYALMIALALALSFLERLLPTAALIPIPGFKLGFSNIVTLYALYAFGPAAALLILVIRCTLGAVFAGSVSALAFSLCGGLLAFGLMVLLRRLRPLSILGVSMGGAAAHSVGQVLAAMALLGSTAPVYYLPPLLPLSLVAGLLTGGIAAVLLRRVPAFS
jgi:heptaprenyl diphosphate synthase